MKSAKLFLSFSVFLLLAGLIIALASNFILMNGDENGEKHFYIGVTFCGNTAEEAKLLIDKVKDYTNLFIVNSGPVSKNEAILDEICYYAINSKLNIIVYFGIFDQDWQLPWIDMAKHRFGDQFLGIYFFDEPAGSILDYEFPTGTALDIQYDAFLSNPPENYQEMTNFFINSWHTMPGLHTIQTRPTPPTTFTSDYALYWFGYLAGYDVLLAQFGWNHTIEQDIALVRGAANLQGKSWGAILTWTYTEPPYLAGGEEIYEQMLMAHESGAEYIAIFNYAEEMDGAYGILQEEHFEALERFWNEVVQKPEVVHGGITADAVLVLPRNYGWGMRSPDDTIWGLWGPDEKSPQVWAQLQNTLSKNGLRLDIVYDDPEYPITANYKKIYYWNHTG